MLESIGAITYGRYAETTSAVLGLLGAFALAKAPIDSLGLRQAINQIHAISKYLGPETASSAVRNLAKTQAQLLRQEQKWNLMGCAFLGCHLPSLSRIRFSRVESKAVGDSCHLSCRLARTALVQFRASCPSFRYNAPPS